GAGFIASHVVDRYIEAGHEVTIVDNLSTGKKVNINRKADFIKCDIRSKTISGLFKKKRFDIVNHHAAQIDVRESVNDPVNDAEINILGALNIFENAAKNGCKRIINISSGGVMYGECKKPKNEDELARPLCPYGISKLSIENYLPFYALNYGISYVILRYGNVYGPRQNPYGEAGVVAIFSQRMINNEPVNIFGSGKQTRDYIYVKDIAEVNLKALNNPKNEIINVGTGESADVNILFKELSRFYGYNKKAVYKPRRAGELESSKLDIKKAQELMRWNAEHTLSKGLKETAEYFVKTIKG
ncbi:MAG: NAD-dependent epimerase/dehydratase family protein, partial [Elusimicrobiota bacterium]